MQLIAVSTFSYANCHVERAIHIFLVLFSNFVSCLVTKLGINFQLIFWILDRSSLSRFVSDLWFVSLFQSMCDRNFYFLAGFLQSTDVFHVV